MDDKKNNIKELVYHLKKVEVIKHMIKYINDEIPTTIFPIAKRENLTINEWVTDVEDDTKQHTVLITTRLSYDGVKSFLVYKLNNILNTYKDAKIKVLKVNEVNKKDEINDKSFDAIFDFNGEIIIIEIKVTQSDKGFTGATHTTSKTDIFFLIALLINKDKKVVEQDKYVDGVFSMLLKLDKNQWVGEAKKTSSFSSLKLPSNIDYSQNIICGGFKKNKKYNKIIFENI